MDIRKYICACAAVAGIFAARAAFADETVSSPDGGLSVSVSADDEGVRAEIEKDGCVVGARLGISFSDADFTYGAQIGGERYDTEIRESYEVASGKAAVYVNEANEMRLKITSNGSEMDLYVRAYNDGAAFRYGCNKDTYALGESTAFYARADADVWAIDYEKSYEGFYNKHKLSELDGVYGMPMTLRLGENTYAMIFEADLNGSYAGSVLRAENGILRIEYEPKQTEPVEMKGVSPWRAVVMGDLNDIVCTQLPENLSAPSEISDADWVRPGVTSWTWFNGDPTGDPEVYKRYIDLSAEMGWQYVLLDEGWQPAADGGGRKSYSGTEAWVSEVISYAESKGIGVFVWAASWDLDTPEKRARMREWTDMGIRGIKVDFFESETQNTLRLMDDITKEAAELKLMVNYHGCNKPTGERRTWQNIISKEAVYGFEHFLSGEGWGATAEHNCTLPFTRNAVGAMDYTPAISDYYEKSYFTNAHKAALPVVFESGLQCFSDKPAVYENSVLTDYLRGFPAAWDETRLLLGDIGESAAIMRRKGEMYYVGAICNTKRTEDIELDFLGEGAYLMRLYTDGENGGIEAFEEIVKNGCVITVPQAEHGGAAMSLAPIGEEAPLTDIDGHWCAENVRSLAADGKLNGYFAYKFKPDEKITRGEFVTLLDGAQNIEAPASASAFEDGNDSRAKNYIAAAVKRGIINGISENEFAPDAYITREQAAVIIGRLMGLSGGINLDFDDGAEISDYAKMYVSVCAERGIVNGYEDGSFRPKNNVTRAEAVAIMDRALIT